MTPAAARRTHTLVALVAAAAVLFQLALVAFGTPALLEGRQVPVGLRLLRFFEYFTVQSNILVAVLSAQLARRPDRDGPVWRVARADAVIGIVITGVVHFVLLRPLLHLHGANWAADRLLHMVVPALAVVAWLVAGPRPRLSWTTVGHALIWPVAWLVLALTVGLTTGFYPYPFLDLGAKGVGRVALTCLAVALFFLALGALLRLLDGRMDAVPRPRRGSAVRR